MNPSESQKVMVRNEMSKKCGNSESIVDEETSGDGRYYWLFHCGPPPPKRENWEPSPAVPVEM
jgi:hypothetical protein